MEAAAATAIGVGETSISEPELEVRVDEPVHFAIVETPTRRPLFVGRINDSDGGAERVGSAVTRATRPVYDRPMRLSPLLAATSLAFALAACAPPPPAAGSSDDDGGAPVADAGQRPDAGADGGAPADSGPEDSGPEDSGPKDDDAGHLQDAGAPDDDAGPLDDDAGPLDDDAGPPNDDAGPLDDDAGPVSCHEWRLALDEQLPAWAGGIDPALVTSEPYTNTGTGLAAAVAAASTASFPTAVDIEVVGVVVTQVGYTADPADVRSFWVADGEVATRVHLPLGEGYALTPGQRVTFTVSEVHTYFGEPQITALSALAIAPQEPQPVYVRAPLDEALTDADGAWVHHLFGVLRGGEACGPSTCFELRRGPAEDESVIFRIRNDLLSIPLVGGDCVEVVAPLSTFGQAPQLDVSNFSWFRWYGQESAP